jgi:hypothetical protein
VDTFVFRLKAPRPNFALDMSDEEREIMARHAAHWQPFIRATSGFRREPPPLLAAAKLLDRCELGLLASALRQRASRRAMTRAPQPISNPTAAARSVRRALPRFRGPPQGRDRGVAGPGGRPAVSEPGDPPRTAIGPNK